jgi:hypothetical protein
MECSGEIDARLPDKKVTTNSQIGNRFYRYLTALAVGPRQADHSPA